MNPNEPQLPNQPPVVPPVPPTPPLPNDPMAFPQTPSAPQPEQPPITANPVLNPMPSPQQDPFAQQPQPQDLASQPIMGGPIGGPSIPNNPSSVMSSVPTNNSHKKSIIAIAIIVVILAIIGIAAASMSSNKSGSSNNGGSSNTPAASDSDSSSGGSEVTATSLSDFEKACDGNKIVNAADASSASPKPVVLYEESDISEGQFNTSGVYIEDKTWRADSENFAKTVYVGCLTKKSTKATGKKCDFKRAEENVSIEQYSVVYNLAIYEAKTGKKVADKEISGPVGDCPFVASYNREDPKLFADPDEGSVAAALKPFVAP